MKILGKGGSPQNHGNWMNWTITLLVRLVTPQGFQWGLRATLDAHHRPVAKQTQRGVEKGLNCPFYLLLL